MAEFKIKINGTNIFEHDPSWENHEQCNALVSEGVAYRFYNWLRNKDLIDEYTTIDDVYGNMSGARNGNQYHIHDDYRFSYDDEYEKLVINYLYVVNGNLWGVLYDKENGNYYGDFEIPNI